MTVAIDTNVIVYVLAGEEHIARTAASALEGIARAGGILVVSAPVHAELLAVPGWSQADLDTFIGEAGIRIDWNVSKRCWTSAGEAFSKLARRRERQKSVRPRRILADFVIGTYAADVGSLITADAAFYKTNFPIYRWSSFRFADLSEPTLGRL